MTTVRKESSLFTKKHITVVIKMSSDVAPFAEFLDCSAYPFVSAAYISQVLGNSYWQHRVRVQVGEFNMRKKNTVSNHWKRFHRLENEVSYFKKSDQVPAGSLHQVSQSEFTVRCEQNIHKYLDISAQKCTDLNFKVLQYKVKEGLLNKTHSTTFSDTFFAPPNTKPCVP